MTGKEIPHRELQRVFRSQHVEEPGVIDASPDRDFLLHSVLTAFVNLTPAPEEGESKSKYFLIGIDGRACNERPICHLAFVSVIRFAFSDSGLKLLVKLCLSMTMTWR